MGNEAWNTRLMKSKTASLFCKDMAHTLWEADDLKSKSVTGKACNANKACNGNNSNVRPQQTLHKVKAISSKHCT